MCAAGIVGSTISGSSPAMWASSLQPPPFFFFQAEDGIRDHCVTGVQTCALPISLGNRFNGPERGAWYAAFSRETSEQEVAYHRQQELKEIKWHGKETFSYVDFLADFRGEFHDIRGDPRFGDCLDATSYKASQRLARELLEGGSAGVMYPSVRHDGGTCIVCFRPALVNNVRKASSISITFENALAVPQIRELK